MKDKIQKEYENPVMWHIFYEGPCPVTKKDLDRAFAFADTVDLTDFLPTITEEGYFCMVLDRGWNDYCYIDVKQDGVYFQSEVKREKYSEEGPTLSEKALTIIEKLRSISHEDK